MLPHDPQTIHTTRDDRVRPGDDHIIVSEDRRGGVGVLLIALIVSAALIFGVWYFVSDEDADVNVPGVADIPEVDLGVDPAPDS